MKDENQEPVDEATWDSLLNGPERHLDTAWDKGFGQQNDFSTTKDSQ